jgi:hypothetical protein
MSSTTVAFRGLEFEANDTALEVWLALLVDEIEASADSPEWLRKAAEDWNVITTAHFGYGVDPDLDDVVTDDDRRDAVLAKARLALARLQAFGPTIPMKTLNALRDWGTGYEFTSDADAGHFLRTAEYFIKLLEGSLSPDENDARL